MAVYPLTLWDRFVADSSLERTDSNRRFPLKKEPALPPR